MYTFKMPFFINFNIGSLIENSVYNSLCNIDIFMFNV